MSTAMTSWAAMLFLPFVVPIALWVVWSDLSRMKIPNKAVMALIIVFAVVGLFAFELNDYLLRWIHLVVVLVIGFVMNLGRMLGAGDAKFAAAMAPLVALPDAFLVLTILAVMTVAGFILHRLARSMDWVRATTPNWESWTRRDYPMGLSLGTTLITYFLLAALTGA
ncbi:prepilin peptidase CpaA [Aliiroseovarius sediminilitoris]|uniref:Prepilin peptidase CpaA n=1 Tax=Aliiroseovarius sediminilitoris TaxID=1173584 RepID=A0A1I0P575_9RHOB|nr:prepilin peptidase [Aliiroseovarius sediminilitoris]SEW09403.1 prepilin peptidase CpaA [Aliiroseovarius sediminilitoris]